jgi:hypothetical protein
MTLHKQDHLYGTKGPSVWDQRLMVVPLTP